MLATNAPGSSCSFSGIKSIFNAAPMASTYVVMSGEGGGGAVVVGGAWSWGQCSDDIGGGYEFEW